ncbi:MAG: ABC transporter substrate-binding protein [Chloroflexi bacterium]|nr:ABC transporter substrate-binding protein [Chloroflexota bacterium]
MTKRNTDPHRQSPSRRDVLQIFAAGAAGAVGTIALERAPRLNAAAASAGGTLRIAWLTPAQLDPRSVSGMSEIAILNALYDYLFETDAESNLVPALAHAWERNDDGTRYTLQLVEDARFHDGSLLTARDVVWSIQLQLDAGGTIADLLSSVNAVEASGDHSVVFDLNASVPDFLYRLTEYKVVMLKAEAENLGIDFNGTGPFIMEKMIPADRAIMRANPDYWRGAPNIDTLEFLFFDDQQAAIAAVQGGVADGILRLDNFSFLNFSGDVRFNTRNLQANGHDMTRIRADRPPGNDIRVRRAFKLATDRRAVWERVQLGYGAVGKDSPIGPSFPQYFLEDAEPPPRDPVAAAALLAEAGYPDGLDMTLHVPNSGAMPDFAQALAAQWQEAGIRVEIQLEEENEYWVQKWLDVDLGVTWWGDRVSPQIYLDLAYRSDATWNESHWQDERLDALIDFARSALDEDARTAAYKDIQRLFLEEGPIIVPYFYASFMVMASHVSGVELHPFSGRTHFYTAAVS